jgi:hypothetical protein
VVPAKCASTHACDVGNAVSLSGCARKTQLLMGWNIGGFKDLEPVCIPNP